jgi:hypothetical protein
MDCENYLVSGCYSKYFELPKIEKNGEINLNFSLFVESKSEWKNENITECGI